MYPTSSSGIIFRWMQPSAIGIGSMFLITFVYSTITFLSPRIILPIDHNPFSGIVLFLFRAFYFLGAISALMAAILIFIKVRLRWIGLFTLTAFLGSGVCFYRMTAATIMTGVVLIYMLMNHEEFVLRNQYPRRKTNWGLEGNERCSRLKRRRSI